jgi:hypothetical protein
LVYYKKTLEYEFEWDPNPVWEILDKRKVH